MNSIRIALVGMGNCAAALLQGFEYYKTNPPRQAGLLHHRIGPYGPSDIRVVAAFDVDARKVGKPLEEAVTALPNCTARFVRRLPRSGVRVQMGPVLDGVAAHMQHYPSDRTFLVAKRKPTHVAKVLHDSKAEILLNYLPVGSERATAYYAQACLEAKVSLINCMPVFIASDPRWAARFKQRGIPLIGDDVKSQLGATILHRMLANLFKVRGASIDRTYQLNVGGNTDFLNMLNQERLQLKKLSKTEAVQTVLGTRLPDEAIHIGPSDYVPWLEDRKWAHVRLEGRGFGDQPITIELKLEVWDSPNSAGVVIDAIRCCKIALDRGLKGGLLAPSAYLMKSPPEQWPDDVAHQRLERFILGEE
jgi:myo-inositol-1-phosphate synthase